MTTRTAPPAAPDIIPWSSTGFRALLAVFIVTHLVIALRSLDSVRVPAISVAGLAIVLGAAVLATWPDSYPLRTSTTWIVVALGSLTTVLISYNLHPGGWPGYSSWHLGALMFLDLVLALRGRILAAWTAMAIMAAITMLWAILIVGDPGLGFALLVRNVGTLLVGTLFAVGIRRTVRSLAALHAKSRIGAAHEAANRAALESRAAHVQRLLTAAGEQLELIASGAILSDEERAECLLVEGSLRDAARAPGLAGPPLDQAVRDARRRGVLVTLLDDRSGEPLDAATSHGLLRWAAGHLDTVAEGRATLRLLPPGRDPIASCVIENATETLSLDFEGYGDFSPSPHGVAAP
jgi:hypothetical protein